MLYLFRLYKYRFTNQYHIFDFLLKIFYFFVKNLLTSPNLSDIIVNCIIIA